MSLPLCKAAIVPFLHSAADKPSQEQTEQELFLAMSEELARKARRQRFARARDAVVSVWTSLADRIFRASREAQQQKELIERLEGFPPHLLDDIGVARDADGRFIFEDAFGLPVDIATGARPGAKPETGKAPAIAPMVGVAGE